jgi:hypothetical protein
MNHMATKKGFDSSNPDPDLRKFTAINSTDIVERDKTLKTLISEQAAFLAAQLQRRLDRVPEICALADPDQRFEELCTLYVDLWTNMRLGRTQPLGAGN